MYLVYGILGGIVGAYLSSGGRYLAAFALIGAALGLLFAHLQKLGRRVSELEAAARQTPPAPVAAQTPDIAGPAAQAAAEAQPPPALARSDSPTEPQPGPRSRTPGRWPKDDPRSFEPAIPQVLLHKLAGWLTTGNIPVKVGVIISFIGVAFLLKFAIDRELLVLSLKMRILAVAAAGVAMLIIGWRLRHKARVYALSMQGGGAGILFLTVFASLRLWQLLSPGLAFVILCALTAFTGTLAVLQNARILAVLGIVGGFLAPVLTSTGQGSHVVLFSYYLVLNCAILGIARFRAWRELNLIGFAFTFVIGSFWGYRYYRPELMASTMPFLALHFLFYQFIAILYALRQPPARLGVVDGTLVFGTPVIVFALQAALVEDTEYGLAISAAAVAAFYALTAAWLLRRRQGEMRLLFESYAALAVAFATLTIPLALDARWTASAWALEGAALVWVGSRQGRHLANLAGGSLILLGGLAFLADGWRSMTGPPVLNGNVVGCLMISLAGFFASRRLVSAPVERFVGEYRMAAAILFVWSGAWWLGMGWQEIDDRATLDLHPPLMLVFTSLSFLAGLVLARRWQWTLMYRAGTVFLVFLALAAVNYETRFGHFLQGIGAVAWPLAWLVQGWILRSLDDVHEPVPPGLIRAWHGTSLAVLTALLALETQWQVGRWVTGAWPEAALSAVPGCMALLVWRLRFGPAWPVPAHPATYRLTSLALVVFQVLYLAVLSIERPGDPGPLPYIPVLNPFDLATLFAGFTAVMSVRILAGDAARNGFDFPFMRHWRVFLAAAFVLLSTGALVRAVHYYGGVPWQAERLFDSVLVQTSLSVYWGLLGFGGMIWGARRSSRLLWLAGAGFMALVVLKLFLVDLGNSGTVERIVSFIAIGALLLVVGYFAPAPASTEPRD
jgi:uncharacterized membrane protein